MSNGAAPSAPAGPARYGVPITLAQAKRVMAAAEEEAAKNGWPMTIAIVDSSGHLVMLQRSDQAIYASAAVAHAKAETALNFKRPTKMLEDALAAGGAGLRFLSLPLSNLALLEGGLPLVLSGEIVGAIGVSGMQSGQDAQVAQAGAAALK
jgi:uncharacterized protein GlcG (DUF336 family)